jgi:hypothetical protein
MSADAQLQSAATTAIALEALSHRYGERVAIDGLSLSEYGRDFWIAGAERQWEDYTFSHPHHPDATEQRARCRYGSRRHARTQ